MAFVLSPHSSPPIHILVTEGTFPLTFSQLSTDAPNLFTRFLAREPTAPSIWIEDRPEAGDFELVAAYLRGEDIFTGGGNPRRRRSGTDEPLVVTPEVYDQILADAQFFGLKKLEKKLEELGKQWMPIPPAFPLLDGRFAFFRAQGPTSFTRAVELRSVHDLDGGMSSIEDVMKVDKGPYQLFQFSDVILSVKAYHQVAFYITFRSPTIRSFLKSQPSLHFLHPDKTNATLRVAPPSHSATKSATVQIDTRPPERLHTFARWLLSESDTEAWDVSPAFEKHLGYLVDRRGRTAMQRVEVYASQVVGFWRKNELHVCHWVLEGEQPEWASWVERQPGW